MSPTPEQETERRGEPVLVKNARGYEVKGTIEWGGVTRPASIYLEMGGRLTFVDPRYIKPDPGGARPVWDDVQRTMARRG